MEERPGHCPECHSPRVAKIIYGLPSADRLLGDTDLRRGPAEGRVVLGGDAIEIEECRDWCCLACGHEWGHEGRERWEAYERDYIAKKAAQEAAHPAEEEAAAVRRGVLDAILEPDGVWTTCPHCRREFSIYNKNSWDGEKHLRCRTRLHLVQPPD